MDSIINLDILKVKGSKDNNNILKKEDKEETLGDFSNTFNLNKEKDSQDIAPNTEAAGMLLDQESAVNNEEKKKVNQQDDAAIDIAVIAPSTINPEEQNVNNNRLLQKSSPRLEIKQNTKLDNSTLEINENNKVLENKNTLNKVNIKNTNSALSNLNDFKKEAEKNNNIFSNVQSKNKKRINTFFKNYVNYKNRRGLKGNLKLVKFALMTQIKNIQKRNSNNINIEANRSDSFENKNNILMGNSEEKVNKTPKVISQKEANIVIDKPQAIEETTKSSKTVENNNSNKYTEFDRLKNILDIKSNNVNDRLINLFEKNLKTGNNIFEIQLKPENLGKLQITIEMLNDNNVDINIKAENSSSIQLMSENNNNLQKMFQNNGLNLNNFNLNNQNKNFSNNKQNKKNEEANDIESNTRVENAQSNDTSKKNNLVYIKA